MKNTQRSQEHHFLTDKDCQLFSKTYRMACQLYYQNSSNASFLEPIINLTEIIPQIVENRSQSSALTILSQMEILKAKAKLEVGLKQKIDKAIDHLKRPIREKLSPQLTIQLLRKNELFSIGCVIAIRLFADLSNQNEMYTKPIFECIGSNFLANPALAVQLLQLLCSNEESCRLSVREGIVKSLFLTHIPQILKNKLELYKCVKLLKVIGATDRTILRERQKVLSMIIYTYEEYIPIISDVCEKCYDAQYCVQIEQKNTYQNIDQIYLWSYTPSFCKDVLQRAYIQELFNNIRTTKQSVEIEAKAYGILDNYCKYCNYAKNQLLKTLPKHQESMINYLKMCISVVRINPASIQLIDWGSLDKLMISSTNAKALQLHKMLKEMVSRNVQVGTLSNSLKSIFTCQKHADLLNERISRIPKNNAQLEDTRHILKQNPEKGASQFDKDTIQIMKEKSIESLKTAISLRHKLNLNQLINEWEASSIQLLGKFLQAVELNLVMNEQAIQQINSDKILEMIRWMEENYNGEIIDWGVIIQILNLLFEPNKWLNYVKELPKDCFWMLQIEQLTVKTQKALLTAIDQASQSMNTKKLALMLGFLGKTLENDQKLKIIKSQKGLFDRIKKDLAENNNYKLNLMMLSYFLKGWNLQEDQPNFQANNKQFEELISPLVDIVVSNYRATPQEHHFLESCLPFNVHPHSLTKNIQQLVNTHGKLSSLLYEKQPKAKSSLPANRFNAISHLSPSVMLQNLKFLTRNPEMADIPQLEKLVKAITNNKDSFWNLYPHYVDILSLLIQLIETSSQKSQLTDHIVTLIEQVQKNTDIQKEQREELLEDMCDTLEGLQKRGAYIEIERIKKTVIKITEEQIKEQIIYILNNYKVKEDPPVKPVKIQESKKVQKPVEPVETSFLKEKKQIFVEQQSKAKATVQVKIPAEEKQLINEAHLNNFANNEILSKPAEAPLPKIVESIEDQFQSIKYESIKKPHYNALEILNRIVEKKEPTSKFNEIYPILSTSNYSDPQKQLLGTLLAKFYPMELQERALALLLDKERTSLGRDMFEQLVRKYVHAFKLVRRWRFESREALDISMVRIKQDYLEDACNVSTYNLTKSLEIEYFYSQKYHLILVQVLSKVLSQQEVSSYLTLIGIVTKLPQIKQHFISHQLHVNIMSLNILFPMSIKVNSALCYALSTLSFQQAKVCTQIVAQKESLLTIYQCLKAEPTNKLICQPGVCLIANLSYSNQDLKETLRQRKTIALLLLIFQRNLVRPEDSIYKQLLRSIGNLSMNKLCTEQIIDGHFCILANRMAQNLDFFVYYDQKKARLMKLLISLISNLAAHKTKLETMHQQKITLLIITMLETTQKNAQLLAGCIDTVDSLCQSTQIQTYMLSQKRLMLILIDILKLQEQVSILLKTGRLISNLSIHNQCIPFILKSNILSVMGNVVVPNLYIGCMSLEESKRMEGYVLKILTRVYQSKPQLSLVLKSGYLDCLVRTIQLIEVEQSHLQILFFYSSHLPNFLNKRAFSCLIRVLTKKIDSKIMLEKCIVSFKNLLTFSYNRDDEDQVIENIPQMYQKIFLSQYLVDGLFLLVYHLLRSHSLRKSLRKKDDKVIQTIEKLGKQDIYAQISRSILFLIYNPETPIWLGFTDHQENEQFFKVLKKGFKCKLYRADGSHKQAKIDIDDEYNIRVYKYPDGEIKNKYVLNINHIRDLQIDFREKDELWSHTVFAMQKSLLESHVSQKNLCVTLIGSSRWGEVKLINFEFASQEDKIFFYQCLSSLIYLFKA